MRRVCKKYAQSHEKHARRPCTTFASERLAGKELQKKSETIFEGFQRIPQNSKGFRRGSKGCQTISKDSKGLERISKDFKGFQRVPTPFTPYAAHLFIFLSVLFSVLVPPPNLLCRKSINFLLLSSKSFKCFRDYAVLSAAG